MPKYAYRARDESGRAVRGIIEADDQGRAVERLREKGYYITHLQARRELKEVLAPSRPRTRAKQVPVKELALFCRQFGTMVGAGVPVLTSLQLLTRQTSSPVLHAILQDVATELEAGHTLASSFSKHARSLPPALVNMVAAGEIGGILEEVFDRMADHFEKEHAVAQKVRSALAYPVVIVVMVIVVVIFMLAFVVPNFLVLFENLGTELPLPTLLLLNASELVRKNLLAIVGGLVAVALGLRRFLQTERGAEMTDRLVLRVPAIGELVLKRSVARFCRTLATLLGSGVPILAALAVVQGTVGNRLVARVVEQSRQAVLDGSAMSGPLRSSRLIPRMVSEMVAVGEETGQVESMLLKVAEFYERDIDALVERFSSVIQPLIMAVLGVGIGFVLVAMIMPMFEVFGTIQ